MDRFEVRVYPRGSGKTTRLVEHLVKAEKVCDILNSGRYKLNVDVAVEDDEFCEECCCDACVRNGY